MKISRRLQSYEADMIFTMKFTTEHNSINNKDGVAKFVFCVSSDHFYIYTKIRKNISKAFRVME